MGMIIKSSFSGINSDFDLRIDSKFYGKINQSNFLFVEKSKYPFIELRHVIQPDYEIFEYEEDKKYKGLSTDSNLYDDGEVVDYLELTKENHPQRLKYKTNKNSIVISSLKGAKVNTFLVTEDEEECIWSNGFYIFKKINPLFETKYIYYILSSNKLREILDDNLSRGIGISAYYERDLLRIKIPIVSIEKQRETINKINKIESEITKVKKTIPNVQDLIEKVLEEKLSCSHNKEIIEKRKTEVMVNNFSLISRNLNLRNDPKYFVFWEKTNGKIFEDSSKIENEKIRKIVTPSKEKILKKGELDKTYFLVDKEDVDLKRGIIINENEVKEIGSNKIEFGESDLLIPKLRPYLGGTFLNDKSKNLIGTPEFLPYKTNKEKLLPEYLRFILLSKNFLKSVIYLMSGKEHPRITPYDFESIKIPLPKKDNIETQKRIVNEINKSLGDLRNKLGTVERYKGDIENLLLDSLIN